MVSFWNTVLYYKTTFTSVPTMSKMTARLKVQCYTHYDFNPSE